MSEMFTEEEIDIVQNIYDDFGNIYNKWAISCQEKGIDASDFYDCMRLAIALNITMFANVSCKRAGRKLLIKEIQEESEKYLDSIDWNKGMSRVN